MLKRSKGGGTKRRQGIREKKILKAAYSRLLLLLLLPIVSSPLPPLSIDYPISPLLPHFSLFLFARQQLSRGKFVRLARSVAFSHAGGASTIPTNDIGQRAKREQTAVERRGEERRRGPTRVDTSTRPTKNPESGYSYGTLNYLVSRAAGCHCFSKCQLVLLLP